MNRMGRLKLLAAAEQDKRLQQVLLQQCKSDIVFWFNHFCWTFDPRKAVPDLPFTLYPFQEDFVRDLCSAIDAGEDVGIEKSRDMGVSWLVMLVFQWYWLFHPGSNFHVGSRKEKEVDKGYMDPAETLFGKFRYNLQYLPRWMKPLHWEKKSRLLSIENPANGNFLTGESANAAFSRGARKKAVGFDEFAFWEFADGAYTAASQTTPCRIVWSTPYGAANKYARLMRGEG